MLPYLFRLVLIFVLLLPPGVCTCHASEADASHQHDEDEGDSPPIDFHHHNHEHAPSCPMVRAHLLPGNLDVPVDVPQLDDIVMAVIDLPLVLLDTSLAVGSLPQVWIAPGRSLVLMLRALLT